MVILDSGERLMTGDQLTPLLARLHDADDRIAMGLPQQVVDRLPVESHDYVADLVSTSPEVLAGIVEDGPASQPRRFFSGQLLALLGDPRIKPDMPEMVDIPPQQSMSDLIHDQLIRCCTNGHCMGCNETGSSRNAHATTCTVRRFA